MRKHSMLKTYLFVFHIDISRNELGFIWMFYLLVQKIIWKCFCFFKLFLVNIFVDCLTCLIFYCGFACNHNIFDIVPFINNKCLFVRTCFLIDFIWFTGTSCINMFSIIYLICWSLVRVFLFCLFFSFF